MESSDGTASLRPRKNSEDLTSRRLTIPVLFLTLVPFIVAVLWRYADGYGLTGGDYAQYLSHAKALAEGRAYGDTGYIFSSYARGLAPPAYPPGLPLTLVALFKLGGWNLDLARIFTVVTAVCFLVFAGQYFARRTNRWMGAGVILMSGLSPNVVHGASQILTDLPFAALIWGVILLSDVDEWSRGRMLTVTVLGLCAMLYRMAGLALIPTMFLFALPQWRKGNQKPLFSAGAWTALLLLGLLAVSLRSASFGIPSLIGDVIVTTHVQGKLFVYYLPLLQSLLYPFPWDRANDVFHVIALAIMLLGLAAWLYRFHFSFLAAFAVSYGSMLLLVSATGGRYLWPLYPLFTFGFLNGIRVGLRSLGFQGRQAARVPLWTAAAIGAAALLSSMVLAPPVRARTGSLSEQPDVQDLFRYLKNVNARKDVRVVFVKPRVLTWETGIPAMTEFQAPPTETLAELCRQRITHVVLGDIGLAKGRDDAMRRSVGWRPEAFEKEYVNESFEVYRFRWIADSLSSEKIREGCKVRS